MVTKNEHTPGIIPVPETCCCGKPKLQTSTKNQAGTSFIIRALHSASCACEDADLLSAFEQTLLLVEVCRFEKNFVLQWCPALGMSVVYQQWSPGLYWLHFLGYLKEIEPCKNRNPRTAPRHRQCKVVTWEGMIFPACTSFVLISFCSLPLGLFKKFCPRNP